MSSLPIFINHSKNFKISRSLLHIQSFISTFLSFPLIYTHPLNFQTPSLGLLTIKVISKISISSISTVNVSLMSFLATLSTDFIVSIANLSNGEFCLFVARYCCLPIFYCQTPCYFSSLHNFCARFRPPVYFNNYPFLVSDTDCIHFLGMQY